MGIHISESHPNLKFKGFLTYYIFLVFIFFSIFTPADTFGLKKITFSLILILNFNIVLRFFQKKKNFYYLFNIVIFPLILLTFSIFLTGSIVYPIRSLYIYIFLCIIPIVEEYDINFNKVFSNMCLLLSLLIIILVLIDLIGRSDVRSLSIVKFLNASGEAQISISDYAIFKFVIFLYGSPLILPAFCYFFYNGELLKSLICILGIFLSGTRGNIFAGCIAFVVLLLFNKKYKYRFFIFLFIFFVFIVFFYETFVSKIETINWAKSAGDSVRSLNKESIQFEVLKSPFKFLFGSGLGSYYYASGNGRMLSTSELSYWEFFRQVGLFGFIPVIFFLIHPIKKLLFSKQFFWVFVSYTLYLCKSYVDPFLFTSTGFIFLSLVYYNYRKIGVKNNG